MHAPWPYIGCPQYRPMSGCRAPLVAALPGVAALHPATATTGAGGGEPSAAAVAVARGSRRGLWDAAVEALPRRLPVRN